MKHTTPLPHYSLLPYGEDAWLLQLKKPKDFEQLIRLNQTTISGIAETVIGYDSLLLKTHQAISKKALETAITESLESSNSLSQNQRKHVIEIEYDGPDLLELSSQLNLSIEQIIQLHSSANYTVRFLGFSPGFAYLDGLPKELHAPRRSTPRTRMDAGAVAIGGSHTGIYTIPSPGGWNWLGNTEHPLFQKDLNSSESFLFNAGDSVQFLAI